MITKILPVIHRDEIIVNYDKEPNLNDAWYIVEFEDDGDVEKLAYFEQANLEKGWYLIVDK